MQSLQDIQDKIFFETKSILETLCKINSKDELLAKHDLCTEVVDRIAFLRILEKNEDSFNQILTRNGSPTLAVDNNKILDEASEHVEFNENLTDHILEEEVKFTNELNDFEDEIESEDQSDVHFLNDESIEDPTYEVEIDSMSEEDLAEEDEISLTVAQEELDYAERVAQKERDLEEVENRRRIILEFTKQEILAEESRETTPDQTETAQQQEEKKFKLAHIKGLKVVQQLFDIDPLEEEKSTAKPQIDPESLQKSNVKTDYMQAERRKPEFRLDLNDKVAFSKSLFAGNDEELKATIEKLNTFTTLDEAKHYLSEIYYRKNWQKVDEYAQRLWNLVENKFM